MASSELAVERQLQPCLREPLQLLGGELGWRLPSRLRSQRSLASARRMLVFIFHRRARASRLLADRCRRQAARFC